MWKRDWRESGSESELESVLESKSMKFGRLRSPQHCLSFSILGKHPHFTALATIMTKLPCLKSIYSHFLEEVSVCDGPQFLQDEVDATLDEEGLVGGHGVREAARVTLRHRLHHLAELLQVVLDQQTLLGHVTL